MSWDFHHRNGDLDSSGHVHAWQALKDGAPSTELEPPAILKDCFWSWCALCGAIGFPQEEVVELPSYQYGRNDRRPDHIKQGHKEIVTKLMDMATKAFVANQDNDARVLRSAAKELSKEG